MGNGKNNKIIRPRKNRSDSDIDFADRSDISGYRFLGGIDKNN